MNKEQIKDIIVQIVRNCNGCMAAEIPLKLVEYVEKDGGSVTAALSNDIIGCINECVEDGSLIEFEFILEKGRMNILLPPKEFDLAARCGKIGYRLVAYRRSR